MLDDAWHLPPLAELQTMHNSNKKHATLGCNKACMPPFPVTALVVVERLLAQAHQARQAAPQPHTLILLTTSTAASSPGSGGLSGPHL